MLPAQQFSVHWLDSRLGWGIPLCHHSQTGERNGGGWLLPFSVFFFNPWFWFQGCAGNPWASCRGDRLVGAGQVHRRYWQCHQEVGMVQKSLDGESLFWESSSNVPSSMIFKVAFVASSTNGEGFATSGVFLTSISGSIWINPATSFSPKAFSLCCTMSDGVQYKKNFSFCSDNRFQ